MQTKYTYKEIWLIAYPILISLLMEQMIGMTDTAFLGRVGEIELGASAIAGIFYIVMFMVAFGFSIGAQILIARRNGEQQYKEIGNLFYQGVYFQLGMAAVMFALCYSFAPVILKRLVSSQHIYDAAMSYLNWRVFGFFFSFTAVMFRAFFLGTTQTKTLTLNSIVMVLSNVVFNYILIFGKFGVPQLGIAGAAIGSSLAELVSLIFFILYTRHRIDIRKYGLEIDVGGYEEQIGGAKYPKRGNGCLLQFRHIRVHAQYQLGAQRKEHGKRQHERIGYADMLPYRTGHAVGVSCSDKVADKRSAG
jgi:multidrug resistance protein, MATE family